VTAAINTKKKQEVSIYMGLQVHTAQISGALNTSKLLNVSKEALIKNTFQFNVIKGVKAFASL
jgi:hypothetical protein